ncbi:MAG: response regulator transcription factor [Clostridia bacterium]|nr:response regulator transcription factor [Clostridia bacterium]MBQ8400033.1 response regulator transcription factor [Clostridia bacterium]
MKKLLIVDDESAIRTIIVKYAAFEGYDTDEAENGMQALEKCKVNDYDLVVLDIMMPELDGFSVARELKKSEPLLPIILLSARGEEYDRINGFEIGVDDYVVKPFSPKELMLRIGAILRRVSNAGSGVNTDVFAADGLFVDFSARIVTIDGVRADLSPKEYDLLFYMIRNKNLALSREKLICEVWGYDFYGDDRTLDTHIKLLRRSLGAYSKHIVTLRGVGYRFEG